MINPVAENLFEFTKGVSPVRSMGLGYVPKIGTKAYKVYQVLLKNKKLSQNQIANIVQEGEIFHALSFLVKKGVVIEVSEINPATGRIANMYSLA